MNGTLIAVTGYVMNVCTFTKQKLDELDKAIKKILRDNKMHQMQASNERSYMRRQNGRGVVVLWALLTGRIGRSSRRLLFSSRIVLFLVGAYCSE